ncbi:phosphodiesterase [Subtercola boreus]|uniref:Phosphodiesterase n=1 Tax=Subtercola boreus TaxID=120213 RepID=A0A3E0WET1_9MICO|nr:phosphodiesterase [Subtercola boreus]RFA22632.1 phosphodiesterase [Subtercola boreus]RFA22988.1 phosphodiesterase [Subtercola boreus]RFA28739.1 phosphodiesterase [Subtercola boreus]
MRVLSHRGHWLEQGEKNTLAAFERSFAGGFGTETDLRDVLGSIVISHDMPSGAEMTAAEFLALEGAAALPLALNIKADGQAVAVRDLIEKAGASQAFVFDMAVPDTLAYFAAGVPVYTRMSEVEQQPAWLSRSAGVWLDAFEGTWYDRDLVEKLLDSVSVCVVSPELHGRPHPETWELLAPLAGHPQLSICTDLPLHAATFFGVNP